MCLAQHILTKYTLEIVQSIQYKLFVVVIPLQSLYIQYCRTNNIRVLTESPIRLQRFNSNVPIHCIRTEYYDIELIVTIYQISSSVYNYYIRTAKWIQASDNFCKCNNISRRVLCHLSDFEVHRKQTISAKNTSNAPPQPRLRMQRGPCRWSKDKASMLLDPGNTLVSPDSLRSAMSLLLLARVASVIMSLLHFSYRPACRNGRIPYQLIRAQRQLQLLLETMLFIRENKNIAGFNGLIKLETEKILKFHNNHQVSQS